MSRPSLRRVRLACATGLLHASLLAAQTAPAPPPDCKAPEYRQFDFWIGEWDVSIPAGPAGVNVITLEEDGCLVHEHWRDNQGGTGQSFNFYNRQDRKWHPVWVASNGTVLDLIGEYRDGQLGFAGETLGPDGKRLRHELTFSVNPDSSVRQYWRTSADEGSSWQVIWDGRYVRRGKP
jgi:hypothetical protein